MSMFNLKFAIVNKHETAEIMDEEQRQIVCDALTNEIVHVIEFNGKMIAIPITWKFRKLSMAQKLVQGEYFSTPTTGVEELIFIHTKYTMEALEKKLKDENKIVFYISRVLGKRSVIPDSYGIM